jgi:hypothetical protein
MQFFRPPKNLSTALPSHDISTIYPVPQHVNTILEKACNDCHSNNTNYPWYAHVQPIAWWLNDHIKDGKRHLNFNEFASYRPRKQYRKLEETIDEVKEGGMPLESYTFIHRNAKLTDEEKTALINWADGLRATMEYKFPKDSLLRKN